MKLFNLIAWVETKCNFKAIRFEPVVYAKVLAFRSAAAKAIIARIIDCNSCSWHTALMIYSSSWGAAQIMGFNLYGPTCAYMGNVVDYLSEGKAAGYEGSIVLSNQEKTFDSLLATLGLTGATPQTLAIHAALRRQFAMDYNGSAKYMGALLDALKHFDIAVKG